MNAGLYLHVPFCSAVCPYCDFAVHIGTATKRARFVDALIDEMALAADWRSPLDTIYLGGGTPSMLDADALARLLDAARTHLPVTHDALVHMEANPEDVDAVRIADWQALGVHFLSLGVQSFDDHELRFLGRRHDGRQATSAVEQALAAGFHTVSVDLMFGLPDADDARLDANLARLAALAPQHASIYQLTVHEGTTFGRWRDRGKLTELDDTTQGAHYRRVLDQLADGGLDAYEVSNFSRGEAHRSQHNQKYWAHVPYLGLGPSAHSFDGERRWWNLRETGDWQADITSGKPPIAESETLTRADRALERVMLGIRRTDGIDLALYEADFGVDLTETNAALLRKLTRDGLVRRTSRHIYPTTKGLAVADWLAAQIDLAM